MYKFIRIKFSKKIYSFFLFLSVIRKFRKEINKQKKKDKFSDKLDKINYFEYRVTSQNNEDGIIEHIFSKVPNDKYFVELGFDFIECNSLNLIKNGSKMEPTSLFRPTLIFLMNYGLIQS